MKYYLWLIIIFSRFENFSGIEASSKATIAECKFRLDELLKQNMQLRSEAAKRKNNCLCVQQIIPEDNPIPRPNIPIYYQNSQLNQVDNASLPKVRFGDQKTFFYTDN